MDTRLEKLCVTLGHFIGTAQMRTDPHAKARRLLDAYAKLAEYALHREWPRCPQSLGIGDPPEECICGLAEAQAKIERLLQEI